MRCFRFAPSLSVITQFPQFSQILAPSFQRLAFKELLHLGKQIKVN